MIFGLNYISRTKILDVLTMHLILGMRIFWNLKIFKYNWFLLFQVFQKKKNKKFHKNKKTTVNVLLPTGRLLAGSESFAHAAWPARLSAWMLVRVGLCVRAYTQHVRGALSANAGCDTSASGRCVCVREPSYGRLGQLVIWTKCLCFFRIFAYFSKIVNFGVFNFF